MRIHTTIFTTCFALLLTLLIMGGVELFGLHSGPDQTTGYNLNSGTKWTDSNRIGFPYVYKSTTHWEASEFSPSYDRISVDPWGRIYNTLFWLVVTLVIGLVISAILKSKSQSPTVSLDPGQTNLVPTPANKFAISAKKAGIIIVLSLIAQFILMSIQCSGGDGIGCIVLIIPYTIAYLIPAFAFGIFNKYSLISRLGYAVLGQTIFLLVQVARSNEDILSSLYEYVLYGYGALLFLIIFDAISTAVLKIIARWRPN